jgi:hypothetical protein
MPEVRLEWQSARDAPWCLALRECSRPEARDLSARTFVVGPPAVTEAH